MGLFEGAFPQQDYVFIGGAQSPGKAEISGGNLARIWDKRKGYGFSGAYLVYLGTDLAEFDITFTLWDPSQVGDWLDFVFQSKIAAPPKAPLFPGALDIKHPVLNLWPLQISSVVVTKCGQFDQDDYGLWQCTISFQEFRAPMPALSKPKKSIPAVPPPTPTAEDAFDIEMADKLAKLQSLAG